jgi:hypothetical protein
MPEQLDNLTPAELNALYLHHFYERRNAALAGWWAGISYKSKESFSELFPDPLAPYLPEVKDPDEDPQEWADCGIKPPETQAGNTPGQKS